MGERFVVVPVDGGRGADRGQPAAADPAPAREDEEAAAGSSVARGFLPILEYNREPNKYGMTAETHAFVFQIINQVKLFHLQKKLTLMGALMDATLRTV